MTTWSQLTSGANETWSALTSGANETWVNDTTSNTSRRNVSRFILLGQSRLSVRGGVDFGLFVRDVAEMGRGVTGYVDNQFPLKIHDSGDSSV